MNRLKELRKEKKLSQKEIAKEMSISEKTLSRWENGESQIKPEKAQHRDSQEASYQLYRNDPDDPYNHVKARVYSILGDDLMKILEEQYTTGHDEPDYSNLTSFLSAVNQLSYTDEEELLLNYGILPKEDKKIIKNLVSDMAEKVKIANKKEPWQKGF